MNVNIWGKPQILNCICEWIKTEKKKKIFCLFLLKLRNTDTELVTLRWLCWDIPCLTGDTRKSPAMNNESVCVLSQQCLLGNIYRKGKYLLNIYRLKIDALIQPAIISLPDWCRDFPLFCTHTVGWCLSRQYQCDYCYIYFPNTQQ